MQIFEITTHQPVTEISFKDIGRSVGKALIQAPVKALGNKVGADLIGDEKTKSATELMYDMQKYFGIATQQLYRGMPDYVIVSELIGKYGANQEQATKALEAARQQLQPGSQAISQPDSQAGSQAFGTMANQLGQAGATPVATTTPSAPAPASTTPSAPQSPEEIRKAKQAVAAQAAQTNMAANSTPVPTPAPANPAVPNTTYQMPTGMQTTSNAKTTMASPASATPPPTNLPIPKYNTATPAPANPAVPNTTYQMPTGMQTTSNAKTTMAAGNGSYQVPGRVIPPSPYTAPRQVPAQSTQTTPASTAPVKQEPISIGGQKIRPSDPLYAKLQKQIAQQQPTAVAESLTWSRSFDPSKTLLKKIKQL